MKKTSEKKLKLGKITIASISQVKQPVQVKDISMTAPICSIDSCRF
jgi:hypothetical protein